ncbi:MAG: carbohydrate ABC transporter permease [Lachnospiraceae bacterium]|nr:carbohydrate ABC transporter permease [Lachnospiraceae bacterium]
MIFNGIVLLFLIFLALMIIVPLGWMIISGFKTNNDLFTNSFGMPREWMVSNYKLAWQVGVGKYFFNSIFVTVVSTALTLLVSAMAAFALTNGRMYFKGRELVFIFILAGLMLAPQVSIIPLFKILNKIHLYNTYWAMIVPYVVFRIPFAVFLMRAYFLGLPASLDEAAYIDGCTSWGVFTRIVLPLSKPIMASSALLTAMYDWNEFMMAMVFTSSDSVRTIPIGMMNLTGTLRTEWGTLIAGLAMSAMPIVIVFIIFQKQFVRGIAAGGVKG